MLSISPTNSTRILLLQAMLLTISGCSQRLPRPAENAAETVSPGANERSTPTDSQSAGREKIIRADLTSYVEQTFPDQDPGRWEVLGFEHESTWSAVEARPEEGDFGYPRFKFVVSFGDEEDPHCIGVYAWEKGTYSLLAAEEGLADQLPEEL